MFGILTPHTVGKSVHQLGWMKPYEPMNAWMTHPARAGFVHPPLGIYLISLGYRKQL